MTSSRSASELLTSYRQQTRFVRMLAAPTPVTRGLLMANIAVFIILQLYALMLAGSYADGGPYQMLLMLGAKLNPAIIEGQHWRLFTSQFLHFNLVHIAFNGYAIYVLSPMVERLFGSWRAIVIYGTAGIAGALASFAFSAAPSVGASGAIFGLLGAVTVFGLKFREKLPDGVGKRIVRSVAPWILLNLAFGVMIPSMDNAAHVGGLIGGTLAALVVGSLVSEAPPHRVVRTLAIVFVITWIVSAAFMLEEAFKCGTSFEQMMVCYEPYLGGP